VNKAELTSALAMRTKMSKADATRTVEALFDDKGIIATELKKGSKVQDHGLWQLRSAQAGRENGSQSEDRRCHSDQGVDRTGVPGGKQLKMAVNNKK
jgi:nucleoid DNA-binding protein